MHHSNNFEPFKLILIMLATLAFLPSYGVTGMYLEAPVVGCSQVGCPANAKCRVVDREFVLIGLANIETSFSDDFTWTQGVEFETEGGPTRTYEKHFYLGSPPEFGLSTAHRDKRIGGCAIFFPNTSSLVKFDGVDIDRSTGRCVDAMDAPCVDALLKQADDFGRESGGSFSSTTEACDRLGAEFRANLAPQCSQFATGAKWEGLVVRGKTLAVIMFSFFGRNC
jgi:hypothetical protein